MPDHPYVTEAMRQAFWDDGAVLLPQVLERTWVDLVELGVQRNLRNPGPYFQHHYAGTPRAFIDDYCNYAAIPEYQMLLRWSPIVDVVAAVLGSERLWLFYEQIFVKDAPEREARRTPWHQDTTYWITGGTQLAGFWITLDDTPAEESL
jgi:ectoine hydroxylase-related dioxygenase (phytanoyl-CoA dioxygenase family)